MPDTPITTLPLSQFPPCCGTCKHWLIQFNANRCRVDPQKSPLPAREFNDYCPKHEPREDER